MFDEMDTVIDMFRYVVILLIVALEGEVERDVLEGMVDLCMDYGVLVYAEVVITARMPYSFRIYAFWAPYTFPRKRPPS